MPKAAGQVRITLYSSTNCSNCRQLKAMLLKNKIRFTELNIEKNRRAFTEFQRLGSRGVPVLLIGETRIDGFNARRVQQELQRQGLVSQ